MRAAYVGCVILLLLAAVPAQANLIANGGFETGDFTGWTVSGAAFNCGDVVSGISDIGPHSGNFSACFGNPTNLSFISQTVATVPGQEYEISFWYAQQPSDQVPSNLAEILVNGSVVTGGSDVPVMGWTFAEITGTASGSTTQIGFGFENAPGHFALDDVSVDPVPEPGSGIVFLGTAAALLVAGRRKITQHA